MVFPTVAIQKGISWAIRASVQPKLKLNKHAIIPLKAQCNKRAELQLLKDIHLHCAVQQCVIVVQQLILSGRPFQ